LGGGGVGVAAAALCRGRGGDVELLAVLDPGQTFDDGVCFGAGLLRVRSYVYLFVRLVSAMFVMHQSGHEIFHSGLSSGVSWLNFWGRDSHVWGLVIP
jgi:hypothetical protein